MHVCEQNGFIVYETFEEILKADVVSATEFGGFYYFELEAQCFYDDTIWKIDKKTKKVSFIAFTEYIEFMDKTTPVDISALRKEYNIKVRKKRIKSIFEKARENKSGFKSQDTSRTDDDDELKEYATWEEMVRDGWVEGKFGM